MFLAPLSRSRLKKNQEPEPLGKKIRSRSRLKKSQEPEPLKNLPAPQPTTTNKGTIRTSKPGFIVFLEYTNNISKNILSLADLNPP